MASSTFKVVVFGDTYSEVIECAEEEICTFLQIDIETLPKTVSYEMIIEKDDDFDAEFTYRAEVIARIK